VAYNDDMFGNGENSFTVTKKLLLKESYPDFLRKGDTVKAGVMLTNRTKRTLKVNVYLKTDDKIKSEDKSKKTVLIEPMNTKTVFFRTIAENAGESKLIFYAVSWC